MFEIGKTFVKSGYTFCLIKIVEFNSRKYALFSKEKEDISFEFYEVFIKNDNYVLELVSDEQLKCNLFEIFERSGE